MLTHIQSQIYKTGSEIWTPPKKFGGPKHQNLDPISDNLISNISGMKQDIIKRKMALQTAILLALVYLTW